MNRHVFGAPGSVDAPPTSSGIATSANTGEGASSIDVIRESSCQTAAGSARTSTLRETVCTGAAGAAAATPSVSIAGRTARAITPALCASSRVFVATAAPASPPSTSMPRTIGELSRMQAAPSRLKHMSPSITRPPGRSE